MRTERWRGQNSHNGQGGLRPHHYCLPVLKREHHRAALVAAATSGSPKVLINPAPLPLNNPSPGLSAGAVRSRLECLHTLSTAETQRLTTPRAPTDSRTLSFACVNCGASFSRGRTRHRMQRTKKRIAAVAPDVSRHRPPWSSTPTFLTSPVGAPRCYPHHKTPQPWPASRLSSDTARGIPTAANSAHVHLLAHAQ